MEFTQVLQDIHRFPVALRFLLILGSHPEPAESFKLLTPYFPEIHFSVIPLIFMSPVE
jgi:hypothetical protein